MLLRSILKCGSVTAALLLAACAEAPTLPPPPPAIPEWPAAGEPAVTLESAIAGDWRSEANRARDGSRHPLQTLEFFGIEPDMNVLEIWPGNGWYSEILAPLLRNHGHYLAAGFAADVAGAPEYQRKINKALRDKFTADPLRYGRAEITQIGPPNLWQPVIPNSMDAVLTFRNVHNWLSNNTEREMFAAFYRSLKVGGVLGVVEHRANPGTPREEMVRSGYVTQELVIALATQAGFRYVAWEEFNANPRDTKDYATGVWTLPPTLRNGSLDRERFLSIGESDRMTLKFVKVK